LISISLFWCKSEKKSTSTIFVSSVKHLSTQEPFHEVIIQKEDTLFKYNFLDNNRSFAEVDFENLNPGSEIEYNDGKKFIKRDNLTSFEDIHFYVDSTRFYTFIKTEKGEELNKDEFLKSTQNRIFQSEISNLKTPNSALNIKESLEFSKDSITYFWDYFYGEKLLHSETESVKMNFFEAENQLFLVPSTIENPYPIYQVYNLTDNKIELRNFIDFETKSRTYQFIDNIETSNYKSYSLCKDYFQSIYYFNEDVRYSKGLNHLLKQLQKDAPQTENDGFINLHFAINCNGNVGRLGLELLDRNYQPTNFNPELIQHIVDKVIDIKSWDNFKTNTYSGSKDTKAFLFIKIDNRKISDVCP
jgi:hypothetical protein